jgi:hypothetical protein
MHVHIRRNMQVGKLFIIPENRNRNQKVLKEILKGKPAPDVPVFQELSIKSPKAKNAT